jgi:hypothetical protein
MALMELGEFLSTRSRHRLASGEPTTVLEALSIRTQNFKECQIHHCFGDDFLLALGVVFCEYNRLFLYWLVSKLVNVCVCVCGSGGGWKVLWGRE